MPILNDNQKHEIIVKYKLNIPIRTIATQMNINKATVSLWISKYKKKEDLQIKKGRGRKRQITDEQEKTIVKLMSENKLWNVYDLKLEVLKYGITASATSLINILKKNQFTYKCRKKKQYLSNIHKNIRVQFALMNVETDWMKVIFSDETTIIKDQHTGKFWIGKGDDNIIQTFKHPIKRNVWGCLLGP